MATNDSKAFFEAVENRRSYYVLSDKSSIPDEKLKEVVQQAVKNAPTAFNMQSSRVVIVTGQKNKELWKVVQETFIKVLGDDETQIATTKSRVAGFSAGYGSILFFEDEDIINGFAGKMPAFAKAFQVWGDNQAGMLQYIVWTAIEREGLGASLQHYGEYSAETRSEIAKLLEVPQTWRSTAIMPFGVPTAGPGNPAMPKTFLPLEDRVKVFFE